jgi:hypothetical protein
MLRYRPTKFGRMPFAVRKCIVRTERRFQGTGDGRIDGWYWLIALVDPTRVYAASPDWQWFVADIESRKDAAAVGSFDA